MQLLTLVETDAMKGPQRGAYIANALTSSLKSANKPQADQQQACCHLTTTTSTNSKHHLLLQLKPAIKIMLVSTNEQDSG